MKKIFIFIVLFAIIFISTCDLPLPIDTKTFAGSTYVRYPGNHYILDTLINSSTNKLPADTFYIDFSGFPNFWDLDSITVHIYLDSIAGKFGAKIGDSTGRNKVQAKIRPFLRFPTIVPSPGLKYMVEDTTLISFTSLSDSLTAFRLFQSLSYPITSTQIYKFIIRHNYNTIAAINAQAKTIYKLLFGVKKKE